MPSCLKSQLGAQRQGCDKRCTTTSSISHGNLGIPIFGPALLLLAQIAIPRSFLEGNWEYLNAKLLGYSWAFAEGEQEKKSLFLSVFARILSQWRSEKALGIFFASVLIQWCKMYWVKCPSCCPTKVKVLLSSLMRWGGNWHKRMWKKWLHASVFWLNVQLHQPGS